MIKAILYNHALHFTFCSKAKQSFYAPLLFASLCFYVFLSIIFVNVTEQIVLSIITNIKLGLVHALRCKSNPYSRCISSVSKMMHKTITSNNINSTCSSFRAEKLAIH